MLINYDIVVHEERNQSAYKYVHIHLQEEAVKLVDL